MNVPPGMHASAGLLIQEPDGRVWIVKPKGGYAGYDYTFPKGSQDSGESLQVAAIREAYEESGLIGEITGFAGDYKGSQSMTRYYLAKRVAGSPTAFGPESEGVSLIPPGQLDQYLNSQRDKNIAGEHFPATGNSGQPAKTPEQTIGKPIKLADLKQVGGTLGTTPGGVYEDQDGNQLYVKLQDQDRSKNEMLSAALASAAGLPTFRYHPLEGGEGQASEMIPIAKEGTASLNAQDLQKVQADFAIQAWLANWDAAGAGSEKPEMNQGILPNGQAVTLDWGGALLYRGMGAPKGKAFGDTVDEWDSLRSIKNPTTAKLYGNMTKEQLIESAKRVSAISDQQITKLVNQHGPGTAAQKSELAQKLIKRRDDITAKAKALVPPKPLEPHELRAKIAGWNPPKKPQAAVTDYKGTGYEPMNALCRFFDMQPDDPSTQAQHIREITTWLDKASSKEEVVMYRGIKGDYADRVKMVGNLPGAVGRLLSDDGFVSMSASKAFADNWHHGSGLTLKITVPAGTKMASVYTADHHDSEYEAIAQRGTLFRITKWEPYSKTYEVELVQDHMKS
jgi:ADP-ribose pyrophosphatase YjhB (NUDIX family)